MKKNEIAKLILDDRERINNLIKNYSLKNVCIAIKANIPGMDKNIWFNRVIVEYFSNNAKKLLKKKKYSKIVISTNDGFLILYITNLDSTFENANDLKQATIALEESEIMGRLVDIDVYYANSFSLRRKEMRKCLLCDDFAVICNRLRRHPNIEIVNKMENIVTMKLPAIIKPMISESMKLELNLHPKFGLVTPLTNGSHQDMDYELMMKSIKYLTSPLCDLFMMGLNTNNLPELFTQIRDYGLKIEKGLFTITKGINTYKGLIFGLGIVIAASGYLLKSGKKDFNYLFEIIKKMTKSLKNELIDLANRDEKTAGVTAYKKYKVGGARLEAYNGFPSIRNVTLESLSNEHLLNTLINLIIVADDTTTIKRVKSLEEYYLVKEKFVNLNVKNQKAVDELNDYCIANKLSFGGAADLLIIKIYLFMFKNYFYEEGEKNEEQKIQ